MKHDLKISISKKPKDFGIVRCQRRSIRERLLYHLLGEKHRVTVIVPGKSVEEICITEVQNGGVVDETV